MEINIRSWCICMYAFLSLCVCIYLITSCISEETVAKFGPWLSNKYIYVYAAVFFPTILCGVLVFSFASVRQPPPPPYPPPLHTQLCNAQSCTQQLCYTILHTRSYHTQFFTYHKLSHATLSHTIFRTCTQLCHTWSFIPNFSHAFVHKFVTRNLSDIIFHTQLYHTQSFTYNPSHTTLSHAIFHTTLIVTYNLSHGDIYGIFPWRAWRGPWWH